MKKISQAVDGTTSLDGTEKNYCSVEANITQQESHEIAVSGESRDYFLFLGCLNINAPKPVRYKTVFLFILFLSCDMIY
jgi:hypothetical protein